jgi:hypothetical protein
MEIGRRLAVIAHSFDNNTPLDTIEYNTQIDSYSTYSSTALVTQISIKYCSTRVATIYIHSTRVSHMYSNSNNTERIMRSIYGQTGVQVQVPVRRTISDNSSSHVSYSHSCTYHGSRPRTIAVPVLNGVYKSTTQYSTTIRVLYCSTLLVKMST